MHAGVGFKMSGVDKRKRNGKGKERKTIKRSRCAKENEATGIKGPQMKGSLE